MTAREKTCHSKKTSVTHKRHLARKRSKALSFETLEPRNLLAAITVTNATDLTNSDTSSISALIANDGGDGVSLREAIQASNNTMGADTITFDGNVFTGGDNSLIRLTQGELVVSESLTIDGISVGGVLITGDANGDDVNVSGTNITDVSASFGGIAGAVDDLLDDNSRVLNFTNPAAVRPFIENLTLNGMTITGGRTTGSGNNSGGGVYFAFDGTLTLNQSTVRGNSTTGSNSPGGGINSFAGNIILNRSTVSENRTTGSISNGGGIRTFSGDISLSNSTVSGNSTVGFQSNGGGIAVGSSGGVSLANITSLTLTNSTISGNSTTGSASDGGGVWTDDSNVVIVNSTITGNSTLGIGGGISVLSDDGFDDSSLKLENSIVAGNTDIGGAPDFERVGLFGTDMFVENSLIGDTSGTGIFIFQNSFGNIVNQTPMLGPLTDNGGPTQTHALLPTSPAIDAGSNALALDENRNPLTIDQLGEARISGGTVDIGAVEFAGSLLLGDANLDGNVNFLDISPFISLLTTSTFLNEADINRDANVNFLDISPFISLLSSPPVSSLVSVATFEPVSVASRVAGPLTTETLDVKQFYPDPAKVSQSDATKEPLHQAPLVLVGDSPASPVNQTNHLSMVDTAAAVLTPVETYSVPIVAPANYRSLEARSSSLRGSESNGPLAKQRSLAGSLDYLNLSFSQVSSETHATANVSIEESFSTAAELFDAHPESLFEVFDFELEETSWD